MAGREGQEPVPPLAEDGEDVRQLVAAPDIVEAAAGRFFCGTQDQGDGGGRFDSGVKQLVSVSGKLEQRRHFGMARQFGVVHGVSAVVLFGQEVGTAVEEAVEEGGLENNVRPGSQRVDGFGMLGLQGGAVHGGGCRDVVHAAAGGGIPRPEFVKEIVQDFVLVNVPEFRCARQHLVALELGFGGAAQFFVQFAQQLILTRCSDHQIARGVDEVLRQVRYFRFKKKHCASLP
ncbi:hypothetical protein D9M72_308970 [compost metagenome]